jgi:hypothetical protein
LILKRASKSRSSGEWNDEDYGVVAKGRAQVFKRHDKDAERQLFGASSDCGGAVAMQDRVGEKRAHED